MFGMTGIPLYLFIFFGKMVEVAMDTLRIMFLGKGKKTLGAVFGFFTTLLWLILVSSVLNNISEDPFKVLVYCAAYMSGILVGMELEELMAVGMMSIQIVLNSRDAERVAHGLWDAGYGVTIMDGHNLDGADRKMLFVQMRRKRGHEAVRLARGICPDALISVSDLRTLYGGFLR